MGDDTWQLITHMGAFQGKGNWWSFSQFSSTLGFSLLTTETMAKLEMEQQTKISYLETFKERIV